MKTRIQVLYNGEYEALYINDLIIEEGSPLNKGSERVLYFLRLGDEYGFDIREVKFYYLTNDEEEFRERFSQYNCNDIVRRF